MVNHLIAYGFNPRLKLNELPLYIESTEEAKLSQSREPMFE